MLNLFLFSLSFSYSIPLISYAIIENLPNKFLHILLLDLSQSNRFFHELLLVYLRKYIFCYHLQLRNARIFLQFFKHNHILQNSTFSNQTPKGQKRFHKSYDLHKYKSDGCLRLMNHGL